MKQLGRHAMTLCLALALGGCNLSDMRHVPPAEGRYQHPGQKYILEITGYCPCGACCGWRRNWLGRPVVASGPYRGARKKVGYTATGTRARPGTLAADPAVFPYGTVIYVPGYGYGRVEDCGGEIKGYKIDVYFRHHRQAQQWGRVRRETIVWFPLRAARPPRR